MSKRQVKPVYRRPLQELYNSNSKELPAIFRDSIEVLKRRGVGLPGLFLGRADPRKVSLLERAWNQGLNPLRLAQVQDCYAVAESLLSWLRLLPTPVIPCKLYRSFMWLQHCSCRTEVLLRAHYLVCQMEGCDCILFTQLLEFLSQYQSAQRSQGRFPGKLGHVFGSIFLRAQEGPLPLASPEDVEIAASIVHLLIENQASIFTQPSAICKPAQRPPSRAKRGQPLKGELAAATGKSATEAPQCRAADKFAARSPLAQGDSWPTKHLRVVVVPPYQDSELCCMDMEQETPTASPQQISQLPDLRRGSPADPAFREHGKLASVPEGSPLAATETGGQGPSMDCVVGALLSSSMDSVLFSDDDDAFLARSCSLLSCPSASTFGCGESTDMSSVDGDCFEMPESPLSSPIQPASSRSAASASGKILQDWVPVGP